MRAEGATVRSEPVGSYAGDAVNMQSDQVRMDLLTHADEGLHEGGADLAAEQAADLQQSSRWSSASAGLIERTISTISAVNAKDWPIACRICDGRKSPVAHWLVRSVAMRQATPMSAVPRASDPAPIDPSQQGSQAARR